MPSRPGAHPLPANDGGDVHGCVTESIDVDAMGVDIPVDAVDSAERMGYSSAVGIICGAGLTSPELCSGVRSPDSPQA
jgi:hypothetical protein